MAEAREADMHGRRQAAHLKSLVPMKSGRCRASCQTVKLVSWLASASSISGPLPPLRNILGLYAARTTAPAWTARAHADTLRRASMQDIAPCWAFACLAGGSVRVVRPDIRDCLCRYRL